MSPSRDEVLKALEQVIDPELRRPVTELDMVRDLELHDGVVALTIVLTIAGCPLRDTITREVTGAVSDLPGVSGVRVELDVMSEEQRRGLQEMLRGGVPANEIPFAKPTSLTRVYAVASGKGGVGKSTTALNLALGLRDQGLRVGLLDADIYGPSVPRLTGIREKPQLNADKKMIPITRFGLSIMSIGFLVEEDTAMIWRGPMVMSAITQMLRDVAWGSLDVLVVDMPPGTGDAQLTMAQQVPLRGAVIVSTPQDLALIDARRGVAMFKRVNVPVLGVVENMSYFVCPKCGERSDIFGHGGAQHEAERQGVAFLGAVPLHMDIRESSDAGRPVVATEPDGPHAKAFRDIAAKVRDVTEYLAGLEPRAERRRVDARIAYHDACHLAHAQRIRSEVQTMPARVPASMPTTILTEPSRSAQTWRQNKTQRPIAMLRISCLENHLTNWRAC